MAKILGIITAIVLAFAALVASKNKGAYQAEIDSVATEKGELTKEQTRLQTAQTAFKKTTQQVEELTPEITQIEESTKAQTKTNEDFKKSLEEKNAKIAENKQQIEKIRELTNKVGDIGALASKMRATSAAMEELNQSISSAEAKLANLTAQSKQAETQAAKLKEKLEIISSGRSLPSLNTRIRSIYPSWGFVTLANGSASGVVANSTLDVVRGDQTIAKLLVTSVESGTAAASIIPDSQAKDTTLAVGDRVIAAAQKEQEPSAPN
jgi:septal ring factor EnvC (AmiA/AmiB activator)